MASKAGGEGGEINKKNGNVVMMGDDDFWNLVTLWLFKKGFISNPVGKTKSVAFTESGLRA